MLSRGVCGPLISHKDKTNGTVVITAKTNMKADLLPLQVHLPLETLTVESQVSQDLSIERYAITQNAGGDNR